MKRALPCHRLAEDWGETGGGKNWDGEAGNKAEAKARVVSVSFVSPSEKKRFSPNPTTAFAKNETAIIAAEQTEKKSGTLTILPIAQAQRRIGDGWKIRAAKECGDGWKGTRTDLLLVFRIVSPLPFQGKREKRREEQSSSVERTDGGAPDRLRVNARVGPPTGRGNFGRIGSGLVCFCFPGNVWGLCAWVGARIRTFEIRWRGERAIFWGEDPPARQRTGKDEAGRSRREKKILRSLLLLAVVDPSKQRLF